MPARGLATVDRVSRNPSDTKKTRLLAVILHPRDAKELVTPAAKEYAARRLNLRNENGPQ